MTRTKTGVEILVAVHTAPRQHVNNVSLRARRHEDERRQGNKKRGAPAKVKASSSAPVKKGGGKKGAKKGGKHVEAWYNGSANQYYERLGQWAFCACAH